MARLRLGFVILLILISFFSVENFALGASASVKNKATVRVHKMTRKPASKSSRLRTRKVIRKKAVRKVVKQPIRAQRKKGMKRSSSPRKFQSKVTRTRIRRATRVPSPRSVYTRRAPPAPAPSSGIHAYSASPVSTPTPTPLVKGIPLVSPSAKKEKNEVRTIKLDMTRPYSYGVPRSVRANRLPATVNK
jgi:hypothetical protein